MYTQITTRAGDKLWVKIDNAQTYTWHEIAVARFELFLIKREIKNGC